MYNQLDSAKLLKIDIIICSMNLNINAYIKSNTYIILQFITENNYSPDAKLKKKYYMY
jgi:hypothetical protein